MFSVSQNCNDEATVLPSVVHFSEYNNKVGDSFPPYLFVTGHFVFILI